MMRLKRVALFFILFAALFAMRLTYGYYTTPDKSVTRSSREPPEVFDFSRAKKNYASDRYLLKSPAGHIPEGAANQKYERMATVTTATNDFQQDEAAARETIDRFGGIIQHEQSRGRPDSQARVLQFAVGVQPEKFDAFREAIKSIGRLETLVVSKTDKTNEFLDLQAQRASLEATRKGLSQLKEMRGNVDEFVNLQFKILEIDRQLQDLGVKLGDYDEVNEFCTVHFTMYESHDIVIHPPGLPHRLFVAFTWTAKYYCAILFALAFFSVFVRCSLALAERFKKCTPPSSGGNLNGP